MIDLPYPEDRKLVKYLAFSLGFMMCVLRISTAAMQMACGIAVLLGLILRQKNKNTIALSEEIKAYTESSSAQIIQTDTIRISKITRLYPVFYQYLQDNQVL